MKGLVEGVNYLHEKAKIIHRDLKPRNVVLMNPEKDLSDLRIIDFGVACMDDFDNKRGTMKVGTLRYQPPEFVVQEGFY